MLINLASNSLLAGLFEEAKGHLDEELQSKRDFEGAPSFPLVDAESATVRSAWNMQQGYLPQAEERAREALALQRKHRPAGHPRTKAALSNLALLCQLNGKQHEADALARECLDLTLDSAALCSFVQSERQQLALADDAGRFLGTYLTVGGAEASAITSDEAYRQVLRWKGAASLRTFQRQVERAADGNPQAGEIRTLAAELAQAKRDLAVAYFRVPHQQYEDDYLPIRERAEQLIADIDEIEAQLAERGVPKVATAPEGTLDSLRELLGADTVLIDIVEYRKFTPLRGSVFRYGRLPWLGAFVVRGSGDVVCIDLGQSQPINTSVEAWRATFGGSGDVRGATARSPRSPQPAAGMALRTLVWNKIEPHLGNAKTVVISPAGSLARVSFAALPGKEPGTYLLEERAIAYAAAPQLLPELTRRATRIPPGGGPSMLLIGDVDFGAEPGLPADPAASRSTPRGAAIDLANLPALPQTCPEVLTIGKQFEQQFPTGQATVLRGAEPTEEKIRRLTPDQLFLHFATHGFFGRLPRPAVAGQISPLSLNVGDERDAAGFHPSLLCGLTLAGARRPLAADHDDGVLTAFEVESLDVSNLEMVALSACQTGLGQAAASDGLLGLQRAFQVGGTRTVVASLWPVDDASTRQLMTDFYKNLWEHGMSRVEALRQAQLALLREGLRPESRGPIAADFPQCQAEGAAGARDLVAVEAPRPSGKRLAPFYWAPLVLSGAGNKRGTARQPLSGQPLSHQVTWVHGWPTATLRLTPARGVSQPVANVRPLANA